MNHDAPVVCDLSTGSVSSTSRIRRSRTSWISKARTSSSDQCILDRKIISVIRYPKRLTQVNGLFKDELTIRLRRIPHHHTSKRRETLTHLGRDILQTIDRDISTSSRCARSRCTNVDLDVLVWASLTCPVVPNTKVPILL